MAIPVDVRDLMKSSTKLVAEREQPVQLAAIVEVDAPDALIDAVRVALRPRTAASQLDVRVAELGVVLQLPPVTDVVVALAGSGNVALREALGAARRVRVPIVVVALGDPAYEGALADALSQPTADLIVAADPDDAIVRLGAWLSDTLPSKRLALAHNYAFMRKAVAEEAVKATSWQNAIVGGVTLIPGADLPIMTANQAKMLLQIAAAYGQPLGVDRIKELAAVVGGGLLLRTLARQALISVPVLGWAIKGGIGYTGTYAMGKAAIAYFEDGADLGQVTHRFKELRDSAAERLPKRGRKRAVAPADPEGGYTVASGEIAGALPPAEQMVLPGGQDDTSGD